MIAASDAYFIPGLAWMLLARTLVECGKPDDARAAATKALALYEVKGDLPARRLGTTAPRLARGAIASATGQVAAELASA